MSRICDDQNYQANRELDFLKLSKLDFTKVEKVLLYIHVHPAILWQCIIYIEDYLSMKIIEMTGYPVTVSPISVSDFCHINPLLHKTKIYMKDTTRKRINRTKSKKKKKH